MSEIEKIVKIASEQGIKYVKLTGGEPLLREDISEIIKITKKYVEEVSMTTNASLLAPLAYKLKKSGLSRVNISLHSLNSSEFKEITGSDSITEVESGITEAIKVGLNPVKLNMVVMKGINDQEIESLIKFSNKTGAILQLIEFQELENGVEFYDRLHYDLKSIEDQLVKESDKIIEREMHHRMIYYLKSGAQIEVVRPMHNSTFCKYCTRLRVTSDGKLKACLMRDDNHVSFVSLIRNGESNDLLVKAFREAVNRREPYWKD